MKKSQQIVIGIVVLVIVIGIAGWYAYSNPQIASALGLKHQPPAQTGMASTTPGRYGMMRGGFVTGSIEVLNDDGFTVTLSDGTTKVIDLSATTTIENYTNASSTPTTITADQLNVGEQVSVIGTAQADGSIDARRVSTGAVPAPGQGGRGRFGNGPHTGANGGAIPQPTATN